MPRAVRLLLRALVILAATLLAIGAAGVAAFANAQLAFPHHVERGRLSLYSDRPFDPQAGLALLAEVESRLERSPINDNASYRIVIANDDWRRRLTFLWNYGAGGVNYYPFRNVFLRQSDVDAGVMFRGDGTPVPPPRTLAYYAAHEVGHSLVASQIGFFANRALPAWIREGFADYIAFGGTVEIEPLLASLRAGDPDLSPEVSGTYARYRLLVAFFLDHQGWSIDRLLTSQMSRDEAEAALFAAFP